MSRHGSFPHRRWLAASLLLPALALAGVLDDLGPGEPGWETSLPPAFTAPLPAANAAQVDQLGIGNEAVLLQLGSAQLAIILQSGDGNRAHVEQQGSGQRALVEQVGTGNFAEVIQQGQSQTVLVQQQGDHQYARVVQTN